MIVTAIVNILLSDDQWTQASFPVRNGGLGIRLVTQLAPSAFLASAVSTDALQQDILKNGIVAADPWVDSSLALWSIDRSSAILEGISAASQKNWDRPVVAAC